MWITFLQVVLGAAAVIAIGFLVSLVMPDLLVLTPSLQARTSPGLLDLGVALSAGAAGAYVAARRTGSDALPGVAIAVSLVPPLATVGICLELGRPSDAAGALLLFTTNFAAITVAACVVFVLSGAAPSREMLRERHQVRNGFIAAVIALAIISIPLISNAMQRASEYIRATTGAPYVRAWIGDRDLVVSKWAVVGDTVSLVLAGPDAPGDPATLAKALADAYDGPVHLDIEYVPSAHLKVDAGP
jgi:uncharacterized membrane protein